MIIRRKHNSNFSVIPNRIANDESLTLEAIGLLTYLLSRPDHWQVNARQLATKFKIGRNKVYKVLRLLIEAGYITREQSRSEGSRRFEAANYIVYDDPAQASEEPCPQNGYTENTKETSRVPIPVSRKEGRIVRTERVFLTESSASNEAGADAPSVSKVIWKEGRDLLQTSPSKPNASIIGKWLKSTPSNEGKEKLLAIIRAASQAGTADPVGYVTAALNREYPPPPDPAGFDLATWQRNALAVLKTKGWSSAWGPAPGKKGCKLPAELVTPQLLKALSEKRIAI